MRLVLIFSYSNKCLGVFLLPPWMACQSILGYIAFTGTHLYTCMERGTVRVKCLVQGHSTISPVIAQSQTTCFGGKHTKHEASVPPLDIVFSKLHCFFFLCFEISLCTCEICKHQFSVNNTIMYLELVYDDTESQKCCSIFTLKCNYNYLFNL